MENTNLSQANAALIPEYLDIVEHDSENLDRTMRLFADDCVFEMEPTGDIFNGIREIEAFVRVAMSGRSHAGQYSIKITNWFTDGEHLCIEYTHGGVLTGVYSAGIKARFKQGAARYCITYHMRNGKFDRMHEYIQGTTFVTHLAMPFVLKQITRQAKKSTHAVLLKRPLGITIAGCLMIVFSLAEVVTGFTHNFFGINTSTGALFTISGMLIGAFYAIAGAVILTMKRWAALLAILLLIADVLGRVMLTITGLYPIDSFKNTFAIIAGTLIAVFFAIYIGMRFKSFR